MYIYIYFYFLFFSKIKLDLNFQMMCKSPKNVNLKGSKHFLKENNKFEISSCREYVTGYQTRIRDWFSFQG